MYEPVRSVDNSRVKERSSQVFEKAYPVNERTSLVFGKCTRSHNFFAFPFPIRQLFVNAKLIESIFFPGASYSDNAATPVVAKLT